MALDLLQQFLGGDQKRRDDYDDFVDRYEQNPESISDAEAAQRYRELMREAPEDVADEANREAFNQMPHEDRRSFAGAFRQATEDKNRPYDGYNYNDEDEAADPRNLSRMSRRAGEKDPDLLDQIIGKDSPLNSTMGRTALAGAAAFLASRALRGRGAKIPNMSGLGGGGRASGLSDMLGGPKL